MLRFISVVCLVLYFDYASFLAFYIGWRLQREFSWCWGESRCWGEGRKGGKKRNAPCKSVEKVGAGCPGRRRKAGERRTGEKKLEGTGADAGTGVATLEPGAGSYQICFGVSAFRSKLNWEAPAWRQEEPLQDWAVLMRVGGGSGESS